MSTDVSRRTDERDLVALAEGIVAGEGLEALTMEALAEAAGLSRATVYRRLGSRARLLERLAERGRLSDAEIEPRDVGTRVLEGLKRVLDREGLSGTTVERVAEAAGVGPATVYRHFGDREGLFAAYAQRFSPRRVATDLERAGGELEDDLRALVRESLDFMRRNPELLRLRMSGDPEARRLLGGGAGEQARMVPTLARYLARHVAAGRLRPEDPVRLAAALSGLTMGFGLMREELGQTGTMAVEEMARWIVDLFLSGARAPEGSGGEATEGERG